MCFILSLPPKEWFEIIINKKNYKINLIAVYRKGDDYIIVALILSFIIIIIIYQIRIWIIEIN